MRCWPGKLKCRKSQAPHEHNCTRLRPGAELPVRRSPTLRNRKTESNGDFIIRQCSQDESLRAIYSYDSELSVIVEKVLSYEDVSARYQEEHRDFSGSFCP